MERETDSTSSKVETLRRQTIPVSLSNARCHDLMFPRRKQPMFARAVVAKLLARIVCDVLTPQEVFNDPLALKPF